VRTSTRGDFPNEATGNCLTRSHDHATDLVLLVVCGPLPLSDTFPEHDARLLLSQTYNTAARTAPDADSRCPPSTLESTTIVMRLLLSRLQSLPKVPHYLVSTLLNPG